MKEGVQSALKEANVILDMSASVAVARHLAIEVESNGRRVSVFLSPNGRSMVFLSEDAERVYQLDLLECQYYRHVIENPALAGHLEREDKLRYSNACRDLTSSVSQDNFSIFSGIASGTIKRLTDREGPIIEVFRLNDYFEVDKISLKAAAPRKQVLNDWQVIWDDEIEKRIADLRDESLPNETGGVLAGVWDQQRRICYITNVLASPPDSEEWPTSYIRGCEGLERRIKEIIELTGGAVSYVGEWHTHPEGAGVSPSSLDIEAVNWLEDHMREEGKPAIMLIGGDRGQICLVTKRERQ